MARSTRHRQTLLAVLTLLVGLPATVAAQTDPGSALGPGALSPAGLPLDRLVVETGSGERHVFTVELALTPAHQQVGLMFREEMADDAGMLFLFEPVRPVSFWMRNTLIPLDMLFIAPDGTILNIEHRAEPETDEGRPSAGPVRGVLEINGGMAEFLGIEAGDRVLYEAFGTAGDAPAEAAE